MVRQWRPKSSEASFIPLFSRSGSPAFNRRMHRILLDFTRDVEAILSKNLVGIILSGAYGRGEGGVSRFSEEQGMGPWSIGEAPGDDIDIVLIVKFPVLFKKKVLESVIHKYETIFSVAIDLYPPLRLVQFKNPPKEYWKSRLLSEYKVLLGADKMPAPLGNQAFSRLGMDEALPLLCACGLRILQYREKSQTQVDPYYFKVAIQYRKVIRDLVSSILITANQYHYNIMVAENEFNIFIDHNPWNLGDKDLQKLSKFNVIYHDALAWLSEPKFIPRKPLDWELLNVYWNFIGSLVLKQCKSVSTLMMIFSSNTRNCIKWSNRLMQLFRLSLPREKNPELAKIENYQLFLEWLHMDWFHGRFPSRKSWVYSQDDSIHNPQ